MNRVYPGYFSNLDLETAKITDIMQAYEDWAQAMMLKSEMEAIVAERKKMRENITKMEKEGLADVKKYGKEEFTFRERLAGLKKHIKSKLKRLLLNHIVMREKLQKN